MADFTGRQRVRAAYRREFADRVPFYPILGHQRFAGLLLSLAVLE